MHLVYKGAPPLTKVSKMQISAENRILLQHFDEEILSNYNKSSNYHNTGVYKAKIKNLKTAIVVLWKKTCPRNFSFGKQPHQLQIVKLHKAQIIQ